MAILSTGPIDNSAVSGVRPTQQVTVKIDNRDSVNFATLAIEGYLLNGSRTLYVLESFTVAPNQVITKNYYANFEAFEFVFTTGGTAVDQTEISVWGKNAAGELVTAHRLVSSELLGANGGSGSGPISFNRIYVANFNSNDVSVIDGATNAVIATIPVGGNPAGVDVNPLTDRIYVANRASDNVSVIDGVTNTVIATVPVGARPFAVGVNP
jgi:YVTN family beta-propeller protein